jgi:hypothetical protein
VTRGTLRSRLATPYAAQTKRRTHAVFQRRLHTPQLMCTTAASDGPRLTRTAMVASCQLPRGCYRLPRSTWRKLGGGTSKAGAFIEVEPAERLDELLLLAMTLRTASTSVGVEHSTSHAWSSS